MAAKGSEAKKQIFSKVMEIYPKAFFEEEGKVLRIPIVENSEIIEIKMQLTAAKTNLGNSMIQSAFNQPTEKEISTFMAPPEKTDTSLEMTQEEKDRVSTLLASLGL